MSQEFPKSKNTEQEDGLSSIIRVEELTVKGDSGPRALESRIPLDMVEDSTGRKLYGGEGFERGADQMLLTRMLKGIIPVSDVVCVENTGGQKWFYSNVLSIKNESVRDIRSDLLMPLKTDIFILTNVFHDTDHLLPNDEDPLHNIRVGENGHVFFDFDWFGGFWEPLSEYRLANNAKQLKGFDEAAISMLRVKINELMSAFDGAEGYRFLNNIVISIRQASQEEPEVIMQAPGEDKVASFQNELINRLHQLVEQLNKV